MGSMDTSVHSIVKFNFHGDELDVIPREGVAHVVVRRVCDVLGVDFSGQLKVLRGNRATTVEMISTVAEDGKTRRLACIDVRRLHLWLAKIHPSKVAPEHREKLIEYQIQCGDVLADHFLGRRGAQPVGVTAEQVAEIAARVCAEVIKATVLPLIDELRGMIARQMPGSITGAEVEDLRLLADYVARALYALGDYDKIRAARMAVNNHIAAVSGWAGTGRRRHLMPAATYPAVMASLGALKKALDQRLAQRRKAKPRAPAQGSLFGRQPPAQA